jgi:hypothetical protein
MPLKGSGLGTFNEIDVFEGGVGWIAHPEETMRRTGHALVDDGEVWLVDPIDAEGLDDAIDSRGRVAGVVVLFNHHRRDAAAIATRYDVSVYLPSGMSALAEADVPAPVERFENRLGGTDYHLHRLADRRLWQEWALFDGETILIPESVGTAGYFRAPGERLGVSMARRLFPPRSALGGLAPERVLCGHGEGVSVDASGELQRALREARRTALRMYVRHAPTLLRALLGAAGGLR